MIYLTPLHTQQIIEYFEQVKDDFVDFSDYDYIKNFATKLSNHALHICYKSKNNKSSKNSGLISFYMNNGDFVYITFVSVQKDYRGKKVFSLMLNFLEQVMQKTGYSDLRLEVKKENLHAFNVYKKLGFKIFEQNENSYFMIKSTGGGGINV